MKKSEQMRAPHAIAWGEGLGPLWPWIGFTRGSDSTFLFAVLSFRAAI